METDHAEEEETPLEIEDYSCNTRFEEIVKEMEQYIMNEFRTRPELRRLTVSASQGEGEETEGDGSGCGSVVIGRSFAVGSGGSGKADGKRESNREEIVVEIHVYDGSQPQQYHHVVRLFAVPIFFLIRNTVNSSHCSYSESSFFLSLLVTAVSRLMRLSLSLRFRSDPSALPSPFYYAGGTVPCFVAVGDLSQMMFMGVAPPNFISSSGSDKEADAVTSARRCLQQQEQELLSRPIVKYRFCCSAHPRVPDCCKSVMGCLDAFQLHLGRQSRVRQDQFEGVCVSIQRTFKLVPPRRYSTNPELLRVTHKDIRRGETALTWSDVIRRENELLLASLGPGIFSFGTGTAPLRGIYFTFQWEQLRDTEVRDDGERVSNLDPFAPEEKLVLRDKLVISAVAIPKDDYELNHAACKNISKYTDAVMEYLAAGGDTGSKQTCMTGELMDMADSIVDNNVHDLSEQKIFIDRVSALLMRRDEVKQDIRNTYFPGSLFCRFAHGCATLLENVQHVHTLWRFVVQRLKSLLESDGDRQPLLRRLIAVIGIPPVDEIDHTMPLIVQKLQLLVICARRLLKEEVVMPTEKAEDGCEDGFGAQSLQARGRMRPNVGAASMDGKRENTSIAKKPMRLITNGELLEVPPPLPTPPYTTDILLVKGREEYDSWTSSGSQYVQAVGLSEGLLNDMCLFLYVNKAHEGRVVRFPDFVQWYSPRDFVLPPVQSEISCDDVGNSEHKAIDGCAVIDD
ncbi:unnamed protein product, partial [Trypanosoma congolense IL3000]